MTSVGEQRTREPNQAESAVLLRLDDVHSGYRGAEVLRGVTLEVPRNEIVGVLGANGAGKSTLLSTISGIVRTTSGDIRLAGQTIVRSSPSDLVRAGIGHVLEGARVFPDLTVQANLKMGAYSTKMSGDQVRTAIDDSCRLFPALEPRLELPASALSGGERQMLAIAQALIPNPRLLLLDEPSAGLAPIAVTNLIEHLRRLHADGLTILLVEQSASLTSEICDRLYGIRGGHVVVDGVRPADLSSELLRTIYL